MSTFRSDVPPAFETIILTALAKNPHERIQDVQALAAAIRAGPSSSRPSRPSVQRALSGSSPPSRSGRVRPYPVRRRAREILASVRAHPRPRAHLQSRPRVRSAEPISGGRRGARTLHARGARRAEGEGAWPRRAAHGFPRPRLHGIDHVQRSSANPVARCFRGQVPDRQAARRERWAGVDHHQRRGLCHAEEGRHAHACGRADDRLQAR